MKVKIDYCGHCHKQQMMSYDNEYSKECMSCGYITRTLMCGFCRGDITVLYSPDVEFIEFECCHCQEQMWLDIPNNTIHIGIRNVTDNK